MREIKDFIDDYCRVHAPYIGVNYRFLGFVQLESYYNPNTQFTRVKIDHYYYNYNLS